MQASLQHLQNHGTTRTHYEHIHDASDRKTVALLRKLRPNEREIIVLLIAKWASQNVEADSAPANLSAVA